MAESDNLATMQANLQTTILEAQTALNADLVSPEPSYSLNGKTVSRTEYRAGLQKVVDDAQARLKAVNQMVNQRTPYIFSTKQVL